MVARATLAKRLSNGCETETCETLAPASPQLTVNTTFLRLACTSL